MTRKEKEEDLDNLGGHQEKVYLDGNIGFSEIRVKSTEDNLELWSLFYKGRGKKSLLQDGICKENNVRKRILGQGSSTFKI